MAMLPSKDSSFHVQTDLEIQIVPTTTTTTTNNNNNFGKCVCLTHGNKNTHIKCKPGET